MIIDYDRRPNATVDEKLQSLIENLMLALAEKADESEVQKLRKELEKIKNG